jgi:Helix-turn-helix domain
MESDRKLRLPELSSSEEPTSPRAYRIPQVCAMTGLGRTSIYAAIKSGALIARRYGRCTIVRAEDLAEFLNNLPKTR